MTTALQDNKPGRAKAPITAQAMLDALPHPVIRLLADNRVAYSNPAAQDFFQASASVMQSAPLADHVAFASPLLALVEQSRRAQSGLSEYAMTLALPRLGAERVVDAQAAPLTEAAGEVLLILQERTMARTIDRQLGQHSAARAVSGMAAVLAHEVKTPIAGIRGAAQLLNSVVPADDRALTGLIREEADRVVALIDRMAAFADERPLQAETFNIHLALDRVCEIAEAGIARDIAITREYDPSLPPVSGNLDQLIQVLLNLVTNAAEAVAARKKSAGPGRIRLTTAYRQGARLKVPGSGRSVALPLEICVFDNGPGIPDDIRDHLFNPFVTSKPAGTGLGLALAVKILRDHGGTIDGGMANGETRFRIMLPVGETRS